VTRSVPDLLPPKPALTKRLQAAVMFVRSVRNIKRGKFARAISQSDYVIARVPNHASALSNRGLALINLGDFTRAFDDCTASIQSNPQQFQPFLNRGIASIRMGEFERAIVDFKAAILRAPKHVAAYSHLGVAHCVMQNHDLAVIELTNAIKLMPKAGELYSGRGHSRFYNAEFAEAVSDLRQGIDLMKAPVAHDMLFCYLAQARQGHDGTAQLRADLKRLKSPAWPVQVALFYLGELTAEMLEKAASKPDEVGESQFYIGQWHLLQGNHIAAVKALTAAMRGCPEMFVEHMGAVAELRRMGMSAPMQNRHTGLSGSSGRHFAD
jgi:lipoprotein NlpI